MQRIAEHFSDVCLDAVNGIRALGVAQSSGEVAWSFEGVTMLVQWTPQVKVAVAVHKNTRGGLRKLIRSHVKQAHERAERLGAPASLTVVK